MVTKDQIEEEELTPDEVMDREFVEPQQDVRVLPEWEEYPEEAPGDNVRIEDDELVWERDGFEARLTSYETTHWQADISIPKSVGKWQARPVDVKCKPVPEHGYVDDVEIEDYTTVGVTLILQENFQPTFAVNNFIDHLIEQAEGSEAFQEEVEEKMAVARENKPTDERED
mgnify:CR=1 FL=1